MDVPIWGTAKDGESVAVTLADQHATTVAKDGKWMVKLKNLKAGGPFTMTIKGNNTMTVENVLVGEVWVCSGQSNMERQLGPRPPQQLIHNWEKERDAANYPRIRQFAVAGRVGQTGGGSGRAVGGLLAPNGERLHGGRLLLRKGSAPGGRCQSAWYWPRWAAIPRGLSPVGTPFANPDLHKIVEWHDQAVQRYTAQLEKFKADEPKLMQAYAEEAAKAKAENKPAPSKPAPPRFPRQPGGLDNAMIAPCSRMRSAVSSSIRGNPMPEATAPGYTARFSRP